MIPGQALDRDPASMAFGAQVGITGQSGNENFHRLTGDSANPCAGPFKKCGILRMETDGQMFIKHFRAGGKALKKACVRCGSYLF